MGESSASSSDEGGSQLRHERSGSLSGPSRQPTDQDGEAQPANPQPGVVGYVETNKQSPENKTEPIRSMDSFRARLRESRRDASAPAVLSGWETRSHFWSALDKAAAPKGNSQTKTGCSAWCSKVRVGLKNTATVVRLRPSVLLWPLALLAVCLTAGLVGVELGAQHDKDLAQDAAMAAASQAATALSMSLEEALQPLRSLEMQVQLRPAMGQLGPRFESIAQQLVQEAPPVVSSLLLAPFGVVRAVFPPPASGSTSPASLYGLEVLASQQLGASQLMDVILQPASAIKPAPGSGSGPSAVIAAHKPVLIEGASENETWGNEPGASGSSAAVPPAGSRLWGYASAVVDVGSTQGGQEAALQSLTDMGYLYRALLIDDATGAALADLNSSPPLSSGANPVTVSEPARGTAATWQVSVAPADGWTPSWQAAMTVVVVVVSVVLAVMLFAALVLQYRHVMLLEAMLPDKVISVLNTGRSFFEHYDNVTVLYADIVRYSNTAPGTPWEVVKLLNDVNNIFDNLMDKHGLIKIRRSGEAFMGVGGCPNAEDPVKAALRVAMCAREMVLACAAFKGDTGQRVQIRLGLHSGPAVAAVVGTTLPRFSLLGDTIDIAYFMESTSTIMGVHVSDTTAELLNIADDPLIMLQPRGVIDIKGRGPITTFWQRVDLFVPMATFRDGGATQNSTHLTSNNLGGGGGGGNRHYDDGRDSTAAGGRGTGGGSAGGSRGKPTSRAAEIECTADLAVAATLGLKGAPLVRKLSQTGLTQTRRALPDRRQREGRAYENSLLGSFTLQLQPDALALFKDLMARPPGEYTKILTVNAGGGGAAAAITASAIKEGESGEGTDAKETPASAAVAAAGTISTAPATGGSDISGHEAPAAAVAAAAPVAAAPAVLEMTSATGAANAQQNGSGYSDDNLDGKAVGGEYPPPPQQPQPQSALPPELLPGGAATPSSAPGSLALPPPPIKPPMSSLATAAHLEIEEAE